MTGANTGIGKETVLDFVTRGKLLYYHLTIFSHNNIIWQYNIKICHYFGRTEYCMRCQYMTFLCHIGALYCYIGYGIIFS